MNAYRVAVGSAALSAAFLAGCDKPAPPGPKAAAPPGAEAGYSAVALSSGTSSAQGLRPAADLTPEAAAANSLQVHEESVRGAGLRPSRGASGISP